VALAAVDLVEEVAGLEAEASAVEEVVLAAVVHRGDGSYE
jgi:hypothetical protein